MKTKSPSPAKRSANVVVLTGGIGSGKSTVAKYLERWGASVVDADLLARAAVAPGTPGLAAVIKHFGSQIVLEDGTLDRSKLAAIIFTDKASRKALESILHPIIRTMWLEKLALIQRNPLVDLIVYVLPLFFESGFKYPEVNKIILVTAPEEQRIARIVERDELSPEAARARIQAQLSDDEKIKRSHYIIFNDSSLGNLEAQARIFFSKIAKKV
jgi:dephospho-CoA kinase